MRKLLFILPLVILLLLPCVFSNNLDCQYTERESYVEEEPIYYWGNDILERKLEFQSEIINATSSVKFKIYNPWIFPINISVLYETFLDAENVTYKMVSGYIQPNQSGELMGKLIDNSLGDIKWEFNQPDIEVKYQKITKSRT
ncbi:MAG: hypothetical protein ABIE94_04595, partial [archaeon]